MPGLSHQIRAAPVVRERLDTARHVETPEGVELALHVAGPYPRAIAWGFDLVIRFAVAFGAGLVLGIFGALGQGLMLLISFALVFLYPVLFEVLGAGATPGKRIVGLSVVQTDGAPVGWTPSVARNLVRFADFLPPIYGAGLVSMLLSPDFQRLGDRAAGTLVVHTVKAGRARPLPKAPVRAPAQALLAAERRTVDSFAARLGDVSRERARELADIAAPLTGARGDEGVSRLVGLARWLRGER
ncbi:MAG: RDD family protein [Planctomycetota bacterium]